MVLNEIKKKTRKTYNEDTFENNFYFTAAQ